MGGSARVLFVMFRRSGEAGVHGGLFAHEAESAAFTTLVTVPAVQVLTVEDVLRAGRLWRGGRAVFGKDRRSYGQLSSVRW